jgi:hypothetical protein
MTSLNHLSIKVVVSIEMRVPESLRLFFILVSTWARISGAKVRRRRNLGRKYPKGRQAGEYAQLTPVDLLMLS